MRRIVWLTLVFLSGVAVFASGRTYGRAAAGKAQPDVILRKLAAAVASGRISRIELIEMPGNIETRINVTPEMLEHLYDHGVVLERGPQPVRVPSKLVTALRRETATLRAGQADLRWGIIFYSADKNRIGAVYFDKFGERGYVDEMPVVFGGALEKWASSIYSGWK